jgi:hypothetical protein
MSDNNRTEFHIEYRADGFYRVPNHVGDTIKILPPVKPEDLFNKELLEEFKELLYPFKGLPVLNLSHVSKEELETIALQLDDSIENEK